jgi:hypothetical protein
VAGADVGLLGDELLLWFSADEEELGQCLDHDGHPPFTYDEEEDSRPESP